MQARPVPFDRIRKSINAHGALLVRTRKHTDMQDSHHTARASIISAMEYLASARLQSRGKWDGGDSAAIYRAETLLRRALCDLHDEHDERRSTARAPSPAPMHAGR